MELLSIQSHVSWGYVGNSVAVPLLSAMGVKAWPVDTVRLAHHPGHGPCWRHDVPPMDLSAQITDVLRRCDSCPDLLMGYLGNAEQGRAALKAYRELCPAGKILIDPVFGDDPAGIYVDPAIVDFYGTTAIDIADVLLPNRFELEVLSGCNVNTVDEAIHAGRTLLARNIGVILASSVPLQDGWIGTLCLTTERADICRSQRRPLHAKGTGDMLSAAFAGFLTHGDEPHQALARAQSIVDYAVNMAAAHDLQEMDIPSVLRELGSALNPKPSEISRLQ